MVYVMIKSMINKEMKMKEFIMCFGPLIIGAIGIAVCVSYGVYLSHKAEMKKLELVEKGIIKYQIIEERKEK